MRIGFERTLEQDVAFGIRQLVDIALRAMSPAVNDPYTAVQAVQHVTVLLSAVVERGLGPEVWRDRDGVVRVVLPRPGIAEHLDLACGQLRRVGAQEPQVVVALLELLGDVGRRATSVPDRTAVRREIDLLADDARRAIQQPADLAIVETAVASALDASSAAAPSTAPGALEPR